MVPTSILWIGLAILALALLIIIGLLAHRVNRASTVFVGYIATDHNGDVFLYGLKPSRNNEFGVWETVEGDESALLVPEYMRTAMEPPTWEEEPRLIELWMSTSPEMPSYPVQQEDDTF